MSETEQGNIIRGPEEILREFNDNLFHNLERKISELEHDTSKLAGKDLITVLKEYITSSFNKARIIHPDWTNRLSTAEETAVNSLQDYTSLTRDKNKSKDEYEKRKSKRGLTVSLVTSGILYGAIEVLGWQNDRSLTLEIINSISKLDTEAIKNYLVGLGFMLTVLSYPAGIIGGATVNNDTYKFGKQKRAIEDKVYQAYFGIK